MPISSASSPIKAVRIFIRDSDSDSDSDIQPRVKRYHRAIVNEPEPAVLSSFTCFSERSGNGAAAAPSQTLQLGLSVGRYPREDDVQRRACGYTASYLAISGSARLSSATSGAGMFTGYYSREHDGSGETRPLSAERYEAIIDLSAPAPTAAARRWYTRNLCYEFDDEFPEAAKPAVLRAFETWEEPLDFTFSLSQRPPGKADIVIGMYSGDRGDGHPFSPGPGGVLAHATLPPYGRMNFNRDQPWWYELVPPRAGELFFDFQTAAVHEIGHVLGLDHIDDCRAVMYPSVGFCELRRGLTDADVCQLKLLYDPDLNY